MGGVWISCQVQNKFLAQSYCSVGTRSIFPMQGDHTKPPNVLVVNLRSPASHCIAPSPV